MYVSILISTWNNADELDKTLSSLVSCVREMTLDLEVVVVNNNCSDHTDEVVSRYRELLPLKSVFEERQGLSHGRNAALAVATGEWLIFTDDDVRPSRPWLESYLRAFKDFRDGYFFGGPVVSCFEGGAPPDELLSVASAAIRGFSLDYNEPTVTERTFAGANWAVASRMLSLVGGFDTSLGLASDREMRFGEETEIQTRLKRKGIRPLYLPDAALPHTVPAIKTKPRYIFARAEALAYQKGRSEPLGAFGLVKLCLSLVWHFLLFRLDKNKRKAGEDYVQERKFVLRRGRLTGKIRRLMDSVRGRSPEPDALFSGEYSEEIF